MAELADEGQVRTFVGSREEVLVWGLVQVPHEAVVLDSEGDEGSFDDWARAVEAEVGPTRPDGADVPGAVVAHMGCPGEPIGDRRERSQDVTTGLELHDAVVLDAAHRGMTGRHS